MASFHDDESYALAAEYEQLQEAHDTIGNLCATPMLDDGEAADAKTEEQKEDVKMDEKEVEIAAGDDDSEALRNAGNAKLDAGDSAGALELYEQAVAAAADDDARRKAYLNASAACGALGDQLRAEEFATLALKIAGTDPRALFRRAVARRLLLDWEGAYDDLGAAMELDPDEPSLRSEMRRLHRDARDHEMATAKRRKTEAINSLAAKLGPNDAAGAVKMSDVVAAIQDPFYAEDPGEGSGALELLQQALASNPRIQKLKDAGFILALTSPKPCSSINDASSLAAKRREGGGAPFFVDAVCRGDAPYADGVAFRLVFGSRWPLAPPRVRVASLSALSIIDDDNDNHHARRLGLQGYAAILDAHDAPVAQFDLGAVLSALCGSLREPEDPDAAAAWRPFAALQMKKRRVIDAYRRDFSGHALPIFLDMEEKDAYALAFASDGGSPFAAPLLPKSALAPRLAAALEEASTCATPEARDAALAGAVDFVCDGVYAFDLFAPEFVAALLGEVDAFYASKLPAARPNSMNNYGVIVNDVGLEPFVKALQDKVCGPLAQALFKTHPHGHPAADFDSTHSFIVKYRGDEDPHLDVHTDDSDVTFNVCLGRDFEGCGLVFCGMIGAKDHRQHCKTYEHRVGTCVCHLGSKRHGADDITRGERLNLIVWNHGLAFRESPGATQHQKNFEKEEAAPDPRCVSYTHDRDYGKFKPYPAGKESFKQRGWCPPRGTEYPGFEPDSL